MLFRLFENYNTQTKPRASDLNAIARGLNRAVGRNGIRLSLKSDGGLVIEGEKGAGGPVFSGRVWIHRVGLRYDLAGTVGKWIRVIVGETCSVTWTDSEPPTPLPNGEAWYEVAQTSGDIHCYL
jgi:hypothetical protein